MNAELSADDYRDLLAAALSKATDADTTQPELQTLFTPSSHRTALYIDNTVVKGGRGVGKTFWYHSLLNDRLREVAAREYGIERLRHLVVSPGYGALLNAERYPGPRVLRELVEHDIQPYNLWYAVLLTALGQPDIQRLRGWKERITWVVAHEEEAERAIQEADQAAQAKGKTHLILFDALDRLHRVRTQADRLVGGLLQLALHVRLATRNIRFKVFIRPDMFDEALLHFPDASKLTASNATLKWSRTNLYGLLFHTLGNHDSELAARFRRLTGEWESELNGQRYKPPTSLSGDEKVQTNWFTDIAGPYMGSDYRKGRTYTWLPNHLMDGKEQISPRSFLSALSKAVAYTREEHASHRYAIHHEGIRRGVQVASKTRVQEIREDMPWVHLAIQPLSGQRVPIDEQQVVKAWEEADLIELLQEEAKRYEGTDEEASVRTGPRHPDNPRRLIEELIAIGVMQRRRDGRIDLPDVYRIAFNIGRKGGVPRLSAST